MYHDQSEIQDLRITILKSYLTPDICRDKNILSVLDKCPIAAAISTMIPNTEDGKGVTLSNEPTKHGN